MAKCSQKYDVLRYYFFEANIGLETLAFFAGAGAGLSWRFRLNHQLQRRMRHWNWRPLTAPFRLHLACEVGERRRRKSLHTRRQANVGPFCQQPRHVGIEPRWRLLFGNVGKSSFKLVERLLAHNPLGHPTHQKHEPVGGAILISNAIATLRIAIRALQFLMPRVSYALVFNAACS